MLRTLKTCLEGRLQKIIPSDRALMWWMVHHAAWQLTVRARGSDGRTAYERLRGRAFSKIMVSFGGVCLAKLPPQVLAREDVPKLADRWCTAVLHCIDFHGLSRPKCSSQRCRPLCSWTGKPHLHTGTRAACHDLPELSGELADAMLR